MLGSPAASSYPEYWAIVQESFSGAPYFVPLDLAAPSSGIVVFTKDTRYIYLEASETNKDANAWVSSNEANILTWVRMGITKAALNLVCTGGKLFINMPTLDGLSYGILSFATIGPAAPDAIATASCVLL